MAYNTNTKLLLNFNGSNGATTTTDTSQTPFAVTLANEAQISSTQGKFSSNSLRLGNPDGTRSVGTLALNSPAGALSTDRTSAKVFDFWFWRNIYGPPWGSHPLISITFQNGDTLALWHGSTSIDIEVNGNNKDGSYTYANVAHYGSGSWDHYRLALYGDTLWCGLNGSEVFTATNSTSNDLWVGDATNPITQFRIGGYPTSWGADANAFAVGYIDCFQVLDGDTSWLGGTYTVPTAAPDDYAGGGGGVTVALTGQSFTHSQGTITDTVSGSVTAGLTGQSFSHAQGAFGKSRSRALSGQSFTHTLGTVTALKGVFPLVPGTAYTFAQGIPSVPRSKVLAGQSFAFAQGAITAVNPTRTAMLVSQLINYAQGSLTPTVVGDATVALTGQIINHASGAVGVSKTVALSGQSYSFSQGNVTATVGVFVTLTGQNYAFAQGMPAVPRAVALTGQTESIVQGVIAPSVGAVVALSGQSYSVMPGAIGKAISAVLAGQSVAFSQGAMLINPAVGANTVADVTSTGIGGSADGYKTLVLHGNTSPGVAVDSSIYANTLTNSGVTTSTIAPYMGSSAMSFSGTPSADSLTVPVGNGLFAVPGADKIFDFHIRPNGSDSGMKRVFRIDFPENYIYSSSPSYISIELNYDSGPAVRFLCYTPSVQAAVNFYYAYGTDFSLRIAFVGNKVYVGMDGVQQYSRTSDTLGPVWPQGGLPTSFVLGGSAVGFSGQIDEFLITEAPIEFHGYNGGNYSPDITEWATGQLRGRGANTLDAQTSIGTGLSGDARTGTGANTLEAVVSTGDGFITAVVYGDSNVTLDDTTNEGNVNVGVFREAFGANTSEDVTSTGDGTINPLIYCDGASTTEAVTSDGAGLLSWNGRGANSLEAITSTGDGTAANAASLGANTVDAVTSSGSGTVAIVGVGASLTGITSQGDGTTAAYGQGASTTSVTSIGAGYVDKACLGANTTSVISLGEGITFTAGSGGNVVEQVSNGSGTVLISGNGANTTEIYTFFGPVPVPGEEDFERVDIVQAHISAIARTRQNVAYVRAP